MLNQTQPDGSNKDLSVIESYTKESALNGSLIFYCKQCDKKTKTEVSMKSHIKNKHVNQPLKRVNSENNRLDTSQQHDDVKKARFDELEALDEFDFDSNMASSTQSDEAFESLNQTENIC